MAEQAQASEVVGPAGAPVPAPGAGGPAPGARGPAGAPLPPAVTDRAPYFFRILFFGSSFFVFGILEGRPIEQGNKVDLLKRNSKVFFKSLSF